MMVLWPGCSGYIFFVLDPIRTSLNSHVGGYDYGAMDHNFLK